VEIIKFFITSQIMEQFELEDIEKQLTLTDACAGFRGRRLLRSRDGRYGLLERNGSALNIARAALNQDGPLGDGLSSKSSPEKNGSSLHSEVKHTLHLHIPALPGFCHNCLHQKV